MIRRGTPEDPSVIIRRRGKRLEVQPSEIGAGDVVCDRYGTPLRPGRKAAA